MCVCVCVCVCVAHNVCEQVLVTLCRTRPGGPVKAHSQETFCYVQVTAPSSHQLSLSHVLSWSHHMMFSDRADQRKRWKLFVSHEQHFAFWILLDAVLGEEDSPDVGQRACGFLP